MRAATSRQPPVVVASAELAGRHQELTLLRSALDEAKAGAPSIVLIAGEAGVGKTRLVREFEAIARREGVLVMHGDCLQLSVGELPYAPLAAALRDADPSVMRSALTELPVTARRELARVFADSVGADERQEPQDDWFGQARLFGWILLLLRQLSDNLAVVLTVEDLHCADTSSRDFLRFLVQSLRAERLLVACTIRSENLDCDHRVRALVVELARSKRVVRIDLGPLSEEAVGQQVAGILDTEPSIELVGRLFARGEGNPFYTEELLAAGASVCDALPATLREALLLRSEALGDGSRRLLSVAAAAGRPVADALLAIATRLPRRDLEVALRECVDHHVLICDGGSGYYRIRHALLGEAVYEDLLPAQRAGLHRSLAEALEQSGGDDAADRAHHWELAGEPSRALLASIEAGLAAERVFGYGEALAHFGRAIEAWAIRPPEPGAVPLDFGTLLARAAQAARWMGDSERAYELCERALDSFDHASDPLRAALLFERLGRYQPWNTEASLEAYRRALDVLPADRTAERMRVYVDEALALSFQSRWDQACERAAAAIELAQGDRTLATEASARAVLGVAVAFRGDPADGEHHLRDALRLAADAGSTEDRAQIHLDLGEVLRLEGRIDEALAVMLNGEQLVVAVGAAGSYGNFMAVNAADDLFRLGRWSELEERLRLLSHRDLDRPARLLLNSVAGRLDTARGRFDQASVRFQAAAELCVACKLSELIPAVFSGYAELELWRQRPIMARQDIADGLAKLPGGDNLLHIPCLHSMGARVEADVAELARARRDPQEGTRAEAAAADHYERLASRFRTGAGTMTAPPEARAHLATCAAELCRASHQPTPAAWGEAADLWRAQGNPYQVAYTTYRQAEALALSRSHRTEAQRALDVANDLATRLGAEPLSLTIGSLARRTRLSLHLPTHREEPKEDAQRTQPFDLTPRETEVLRLMAAGLTNREISENLFISQHTAGVHVSHILAKLEVANRAMAAAVAERLGLVPHD